MTYASILLTGASYEPNKEYEYAVIGEKVDGSKCKLHLCNSQREAEMCVLSYSWNHSAESGTLSRTYKRVWWQVKQPNDGF
jgi:hypothetical protein